MNDDGDRQPADMTPGRALAAARMAQNLSILDVARQLRLTPAQVEALEAGAFDRLPGPVFARGFMRNYARLLRMDPERLLQAAAQELPATVAHVATPSSREIPFPGTEPRHWPRYAAAMVVIVGGLAAYEFYWSDSRQAMTTTVTSPGTATAVQQPNVPPPPAAAGAATALQSPPAEETREAPPVAQEGTPAAQIAADGKSDAAAAPSAANGATTPGMGRIVLVFEKESWVQIRDRNGRTIFLKHNQPGTEQQVSGLPPVTLVIGNAHGVRLTYNDRPVDLSRHAKNDVARLTLE